MITIKSPKGGILAIEPVTACDNCPYMRSAYPRGPKVCSMEEGYEIENIEEIPDWCPAIAEAQDELPGTADLDFMLNDAIASLRGEPNE